MFRELLSQQIALVEDGGEPMNVFRDPETNARINVTPRNGSPLEWSGPDNIFTRRVNGPFKYSPIVRKMLEKYHGKEALEGPVHQYTSHRSWRSTNAWAGSMGRCFSDS